MLEYLVWNDAVVVGGSLVGASAIVMTIQIFAHLKKRKNRK